MSTEKLSNGKSGEDKEKGRKRIIRVLIFIIILLLLFITLYQCGVFKQEEPAKAIVAGDLFPGVGDAEEGYLDNMTEEEIKKQMQMAVDDSQFSFKINAMPEFEDGNSPGNLCIENPSYNVYPMVVQIHLDDSGEIIYDSGGLMPNQHITNAKLRRVLKKGTYSATAYLYAYDPDTLKCEGKSAAKLTITIKN